MQSFLSLIQPELQSKSLRKQDISQSPPCKVPARAATYLAQSMDELYTPGRQTAAQQALNIPELVEYIIEQCILIAEQEGQVIRWLRQTVKRRSRGLRQRRGAIFRCLLVNRTWNAIGIRFLWEFFPKPQAFHNLTLARRQHFANMVRVTQVGYTFPRSSKTISEQILGVDKFPSLVTLDFATGLSDPSSQRLYRALFQPRLQHLRFKGPMMNGSRVLLVDELFPLLEVPTDFILYLAIYRSLDD
jgi:hypothetical protein